jgi:hypothetical protein
MTSYTQDMAGYVEVKVRSVDGEIKVIRMREAPLLREWITVGRKRCRVIAMGFVTEHWKMAA